MYIISQDPRKWSKILEYPGDVKSPAIRIFIEKCLNLNKIKFIIHCERRDMKPYSIFKEYFLGSKYNLKDLINDK